MSPYLTLETLPLIRIKEASTPGHRAELALRRLASDRRITWPDTSALGRNPFKDDDVHVIEASWKVLSSPSRQHHNDLRIRYHGAEHRQIGTNLVSRRLHLDKPTGTAADLSAFVIDFLAQHQDRVQQFSRDQVFHVVDDDLGRGQYRQAAGAGAKSVCGSSRIRANWSTTAPTVTAMTTATAMSANTLSL